ncbi:murein biosynthesis integral membrane protein MurJ [Nocardioides donggukensis]|uniref:Murein biosynthesis integral membrane protein MurJ n=1 Tax=Nocardioides donggukensis TaxID=2774019 RepID=A0A927K5P3_9ACTN|nr:murein biosynthesis integral membrane protein MurJ [Nocardioides donggukensis]MBD8870999.1 murein biosynthesis integral membrane protein MurJ [Nocardioides donggukensis]
MSGTTDREGGPGDPGDQDDQGSQEHQGPTVLGSSAVMAAGTVVSRMSGYVRSVLLAAALGNALHADLFTIANTIPNMLYILLAGGVFNAVLVPQLVRAMKNDPDGGDAYTQRIVTLAGLFLGGVTVLLVVLAPQVMSLYLDGSYDDPSLTAERASVIDFARYCLPQVFFYGMFVLVGQILNARGRFGPMMWAPITNNLTTMAVLVVYIAVFGTSSTGAYSTGEELLLGIGSTVGIALQFVILVPFLRSAGFRFRPRFDFRGTGLGHTLRLGTWTVLFVIVNQVAYTVVVRLASGGTAESADGTGYTIYASTFLLVMVPHAVVTVSLATAVLPRLSASAAEGRLDALASTLASTLRTTLVLMIPFVLLVPLISVELSDLIWGYGAAEAASANYAPSLALFAPGVAFFTVHYLMLRGFYALEQTRTVFWVQCVIAAVNVALALTLVTATDAAFTSPALVLAYGAAYAVGACLSYLVLRHTLGGLDTRRTLRFLVRTLLAAGLAAAVAWSLARGLHSWWGDEATGKGEALLFVAAVGLVDAVVFLVLARVLRIREVTELVETVTRRLPVPGRR